MVLVWNLPNECVQKLKVKEKELISVRHSVEECQREFGMK